jgi:hypothetical protein
MEFRREYFKEMSNLEERIHSDFISFGIHSIPVFFLNSFRHPYSYQFFKCTSNFLLEKREKRIVRIKRIYLQD